jgi:hypothetical protein
LAVGEFDFLEGQHLFIRLSVVSFVAIGSPPRGRRALRW